MKHVRTFLKLTTAERGVLISAFALLAAVRLCLCIIPFRTLHRSWTSVPQRVARHSEGASLPPERIVWLVGVASRFIPGARCLARAMAAQLLLARAGHLADMRIGVRKDGNSLDAHAWLEYEGIPLFESDAHINGFAPLARPAPPTLIRSNILK
jgi:hypothetical protein